MALLGKDVNSICGLEHVVLELPGSQDLATVASDPQINSNAFNNAVIRMLMCMHGAVWLLLMFFLPYGIKLTSCIK